MKFLHLFLLLFGFLCLSTIAQQASPTPEDHFAGVNARGDQGMGFSHEKTTHHFHLLADGGAIEIQSNEPTDAASQEAIRQHLAMIAVKFSQGDFDIPMFIHATVPPGVDTSGESLSCSSSSAGCHRQIERQSRKILTPRFLSNSRDLFVLSPASLRSAIVHDKGRLLQ